MELRSGMMVLLLLRHHRAHLMRPGRLAGLKARLRQLFHASDGQDLIEYGALIAIIATTVLLAISELGAKVPAMYERTEAAMPGDDGCGNPGRGRGGNPCGSNPGNDKPVGNGGEDPGNGN